MNIFLSFIILFSFNLFACEIKKDSPDVISLSGPVTVTLRELDLLKDKKLKGISIFNPVKKGSFEGKIYPGGLFLSADTFKDFKDKIVFFDEGRELNRILNDQKIKNIEVRTRFLRPLQTIEIVLKLIAPNLSGCDTRIAEFREKVKKLQDELSGMINNKPTVVFYLGEISENKRPEMIIVNDGVVKHLRDNNIISTYPSRLSYVNWSAKIINELPKKTLHIGLKDSAQDGSIEIKKSSRGMTLIYPGVLVPGYSQLEGFHYLFKNI